VSTACADLEKVTARRFADAGLETDRAGAVVFAATNADEASE